MVFLIFFVLTLFCSDIALADCKLDVTVESDERVIIEIVETEDPIPDPLPDPDPQPESSVWIQGYYVGYQRRLYPVNEVDFEKISHLTVGRIIPKADGYLYTHFDIDNTNGPIMAKALSARAKQHGRKILLMVGGDGTHSGFYGATRNNFDRFVTQLLNTMDELGYDGLDLDWEPINQEDKPLIINLVKALREKRPNILLTFPTFWRNSNFPNSFDVEFFSSLASHVDKINIMTYYMSGPWSGWRSWHSSPLFGEKDNTPTSVDSSVNTYLRGVPNSKLGIGLGFFGMCWQGVTGPNQDGGRVVASDNVMSFANVFSQYYSKNRYQWDDIAKVPYLSSSTPFGPRNCNFVSIDDPRSIAEKANYIRDKKLGGAIIWTVNQGYLNGTNPLLDAFYDALR